ncbi:MAG: gluconate kinase [Microbacterium sp. SCN 70-27]|uniref:gluconokinase n=1 Tax=unclassified Microbacterium TaxID=2609290 RepID=UPI00086E8502|nr:MULTISPECIES: gluconokinase [unclassified Microbacterium]ODT27253.1 MAG: gluconate kinase [Microbacterium sp. SCN 70-27]
MRIVVMGPSGSGKSLVGASLAAALRADFVDGDDLHSRANVAKMASGRPLDDADREPWLDAVAATLRRPAVVVACSALRRAYRDRIRTKTAGVVFVELVVPQADLRKRMSRSDHFMPSSLLDSQLATLEPLQSDEAGVRVANDADLGSVVARINELLRGAA